MVLLDNDHSLRGSDGTGTWCSFEDDEEGDDLAEEHLAALPILEGELKRKLLKRAGKNVSVSDSVWCAECHGHCCTLYTVGFRIKQRVCGILVQFGCCQHRYE